MKRSLVASADTAGCRRHSADVRFDAETEAGVLVDMVETVCPDIRALLAEVRPGPLVFDDVLRGRRGQFYRLPDHNRSVCCGLPADDTETLLESEVIVFKGTEPLARDLDDYLDAMMTTRFRGSDFAVGMHFPLMLRMPPGAFPIDECVREQEIAVEVHRRHLQEFGQLAQSPVPLFVHRLSREAVDRYITSIHRALPPPAFARVDARANAGLGIVTYYYPTSPIRVENLSVIDPGGQGLHKETARATIQAWIELFARFLHLGYMPYVPWNNGWGSCLDIGNACIDGGFADLVTLTRFDDVHGDRLFRMSALSSLELLGHTVASLCHLLRGHGPSGVEPVGLAVSVNYVRGRVFEELRSLAASGRIVDRRLTGSLAPGDFEELLDGLSQVGHGFRGVDRHPELRATGETFRIPGAERAELVDDPTLAGQLRADT